MVTRIGIITNDKTRVFQSEVIAGVMQVAEQARAQVLIDSRNHSANYHQPTDLPWEELHGLVVIANAVRDEVLRDWYRMRKPLALVSHFVAGTPIPSVMPNNVEGMKKLVRHLVRDCGSRQPVFIAGDLNQHDGVERLDTFRQEMLRHRLQLPDEYTLQGKFEPEIAQGQIRHFIKLGLPFDGVLASDYLMALAVQEQLQAMRIRVPVVGFGDGTEAAQQGLTTVAANITELGQRGARQLMGQIDGLKIQGITLLSVDLIVRESSRLN